jgi:hypothetical protein
MTMQTQGQGGWHPATPVDEASRLDRDRAASLADEGGTSAAHFESQELEPAETRQEPARDHDAPAKPRPAGRRRAERRS